MSEDQRFYSGLGALLERAVEAIFSRPLIAALNAGNRWRYEGRAYDPARELRCNSALGVNSAGRCDRTRGHAGTHFGFAAHSQGDGRTCSKCRRGNPTHRGTCANCGTVLG